jgi:hypothetical protein
MDLSTGLQADYTLTPGNQKMTMTGTMMARRKSAKKAAHPPSNRRLVVAAADPWLSWVEEGADFCRTDVSKLVDVALASYLRAQGFPKTPPKRLP